MDEWEKLLRKTDDLDEPIQPYINEDGYYLQCGRCFTELKFGVDRCPKCSQRQDWSWSKHFKDLY